MDSISRQQRYLYTLFGGMLFLHAAVMVIKFSDSLPDFSMSRPGPIKITFVPPSQNSQATKATIQKRQIVQSEDSASTEKKPSAFLSDKTRSFDRETISKNINSFKRAGKGDAAVTSQAKTKAHTPEKTPTKKELKLSDMGIAMGEPIPKKVERAPSSDSTQGLKNGDALTKGFSSTNDYVEEVGLGDFTRLNTVEFKFYGFYHRIRQKLEQFWGNSIQEKAATIFRSGRRLPASENLITNLQVTMDAKGAIVGVKILGASGVKELDDAAIESFNQAGPFPNPPKELLVNGKVTIDWGFVVKS